MAGDWIKMRGNLWDDPRVIKIVDMTDSSEATVVGALYWLWSTADQHTEDGVLLGLSVKSIDRKTGVPGFADALLAIGWIADHPEGIRIVDFEEHNGTSAKKRCQTAKRVANHTAANAHVTHVDAKTNANNVSAPLAKEEKSREELIPSVAKATGDKSPLSPDEIIFGYGIPLLTNAGTADKQARSFLGGLRKQHGDEVLINTLRDCLKAKPLQPLEWLAAVLPPKGTLKRNKQEQIEDENHAIVRRLLENESAHASI